MAANHFAGKPPHRVTKSAPATPRPLGGFGGLANDILPEYTFADLKTSFEIDHVTLKGAWAAGVRAGVLLNPLLLVYGTYGRT